MTRTLTGSCAMADEDQRGEKDEESEEKMKENQWKSGEKIVEEEAIFIDVKDRHTET